MEGIRSHLEIMYNKLKRTMNDLHGEKIVSDALEDVSNENVECFDGRMFIGEEARWNLRSPQAD